MNKTITKTLHLRGDGTTKSWKLGGTGVSVASVIVDGNLLIDSEDYVVSGDKLTLSTAPAFRDAVAITYSEEIATSSTSGGITPEQLEELVSDDDLTSADAAVIAATQAAISAILPVGEVKAILTDQPTIPGWSVISGLEAYTTNGGGVLQSTINFGTMQIVVPSYSATMNAQNHIGAIDADFTAKSATSFAWLSAAYATGATTAFKYNATLDQYSTVTFTSTTYPRAVVNANKAYLFGSGAQGNITVAYSVDLGTGTRTAIAASTSMKIGGAAVIPASSSEILFIGGSNSGINSSSNYQYGSASLPASPAVNLCRSVSAYNTGTNTYSVDAYPDILPLYMDFGMRTLANKAVRIAAGVFILCPYMYAGLSDTTWTINTTGRMWRLDLNNSTCVEIDAIGVSQSENTCIGFAGESKVITEGGILYDDALSPGSKLVGQVRNGGATSYNPRGLTCALLLGTFIPCITPGLFRIATAGEVSMNFTNFNRLVYARRNG